MLTPGGFEQILIIVNLLANYFLTRKVYRNKDK